MNKESLAGRVQLFPLEKQVFQGQQVHKDQEANKVTLVNRDQKEKKDVQDLVEVLDPPESKESKEDPEDKDPKVQLAGLVLRDLLAKEVTRVLPEKQDLQDNKDPKGLLDRKDAKACLEKWETGEDRVIQDAEDHKDHRVQLVTQEILVKLVHEDQKGQLEGRDQVVQLESKAIVERLGLEVLLVGMESKVKLVLVDQKVTKVSGDKMERMVNLAFKAQLVEPVQEDLVASLVQMERLVCKAPQDLMADVDLLGILDLQVIPVKMELLVEKVQLVRQAV